MDAAPFLKLRESARQRKGLGDSAQRLKAAATSGRFKVVDGQFNRFYPNKEKALWWAVCPGQNWEFDIYDRESGEVKHMKDEFFLAYVSHFVARSQRKFQCSAGPHRDKPCWGCGIRNKFYANKRAQEEKKVVKIAGEAPINAMTQYAIAGVLLEHIAKVERLDKNGKPRLNKENKPILYDTPIALLDPKEAKKLKAAGETTFGLPTHYSVGITHLNMLLTFDQEMQNYCATCAEMLYATTAACPECANAYDVSNEEGPLRGQDLAEMRAMDASCECGYHGPLVPVCECSCENPVEGKLVDFALRLISEEVAEKQTRLKYTAVRPIGFFVEKYPAVEEMLLNPLKLDEIFAPTSVKAQEFSIPEELRDNASPAPRQRKDAEPLAEPYGLMGGDEDEEDD